MESAQDLFNPAPTPQEFQSPVGDKFFVGPDGQRAMLGSEDGVQVEFFEESSKLELASKEAGLPIFKTQTCIRIKCKYDPQNIHVHPVSDKEECEWKFRFAKEWQQYCRAKESAAIGTPVMSWMEIAPNEKSTLDAMGVLTLEQLVLADETMLSKVFSNVKKIKELALGQLNYKNKVADIGAVTKKLVAATAEIEGKDEIIEQLKKEKLKIQEALMAVKVKAAKPIRPTASKLQEIERPTVSETEVPEEELAAVVKDEEIL